MKALYPSDDSLRILKEMERKEIKHPLLCKGFIFDVDGVICKGNKLIPGADSTIEHLRKGGKKVKFISNNSTKSTKEYLKKFSNLGIPVEFKDLVLSTYATAKYIAKEKPGARVYMIGTEGLRRELEEAGLEVVDEPKRVEYVVVGSPFDASGKITEKNRWKLTGALRAIYYSGAKYIATNPDRIFPAEEGIVPGTGAIIGSLNYMMQREPDAIIGKPSPMIVQAALEKMDLNTDECAIVGDLDTDILAGEKMGMVTVFVLSGVMTRKELEELGIRPDFIYKSVKEMVKLDTEKIKK